MSNLVRRDRDQTEKFVIFASKVFKLALGTTTVISTCVTVFGLLVKNPLLVQIAAVIAGASFLGGLVWHYRRKKNAYAEHVLAISAAARYLARNQQQLADGAEGDRRRIYEELLRAFRAIHDTLPKNPPRGWQVALWAPVSASKLAIIASLDVSRRTESEYFMGTDPDCEKGLAWRAWEDRRNQYSNEAAKDPNVDKNHRQVQSPDAETAIGSILCQIVCLDENVIGVISINHQETDLFTSEEDDARSAVAALIAIAMKHSYNARSGPKAAGG